MFIIIYSNIPNNVEDSTKKSQFAPTDESDRRINNHQDLLETIREFVVKSRDIMIVSNLYSISIHSVIYVFFACIKPVNLALDTD